jgi:hypothetical protein
MKRNALLLLGLVLLAIVAFCMTRPTREKACPLTQITLRNDSEFERHCAELGGIAKDGKCTCPG